MKITFNLLPVSTESYGQVLNKVPTKNLTTEKKNITNA